MKFCDKLIALRKKNGLSQEELASKLNVSRQSVSKWESGNAYPETDKIISIANLFDCSMDDLINDSITDLNNIERKSKNNFNTTIDSFLEFITKTINMFCDMKFTNGFRCLIEMMVLVFLLFCVGSIATAIFTHIISGLFSFAPINVYVVIEKVVSSILNILWFIIALIVLVHIFKIRYLDYYDNPTLDNNKDNRKSNINTDKKERIIIRDENHKPFAFLEIFSKLIIGFIKFMAFCLLCMGIFSLIWLVAGFVISISLFIFNTLFIGIDIALISIITLNILVLLLLFNFIFNRKSNFKLLFIIAITSIVMFGAGCGLTAIGFKDYTITDSIYDLNNKTDYINIAFEDDMIINNWYESVEYIIDNNINDVKIEYDSNNDMSEVTYDYYTDENYKIYHLSYSNNVNLGKLYNLIKNDLSNNIIRSYNFDLFNIKVYSNESNINKILDNTKKLFDYDIEKTSTGFIIDDLDYHEYDDFDE